MILDLMERMAERLWYRRRGLVFLISAPLLGPWTLLTSMLSRRRKRPRSLARLSEAIPVIGVGNLTVGGTGKTQVVLELARRAIASGRRVAIVTRGYRAREPGPAIVPPGGDALRFGDEPVLLGRRLPEASVIVSRDRAAGVALAISRGCDLVLLDDGFQQTAVIPARQILVFGAESPLGNGALLPLGPLRDPLSALRGDELIWLHGEGEGSVLPRVDVRSRTVPAAEGLRGRPVFAFAGIARPERFLQTLSEAGATVVGTARFADHRRFSRRDLERLAARAASLGAEALVCTEKDAVRLPHATSVLRVLTLETRLEIVEGQPAVDRLLDS
jgi:tetraacyldisaccharide 4'-kinase